MSLKVMLSFLKVLMAKVMNDAREEEVDCGGGGGGSEVGHRRTAIVLSRVKHNSQLIK